MADERKTIDSPDEKSVGSRDPKGPIPENPVREGGNSGGEAGGSDGAVPAQDNPTSYPAG